MFKRILMNAVDAGSGNGAASVETPVEQPQAQAAPTANPIENIVASLATQVESLAKSVNSLHAADRRAREGKAAPAKPDASNGNAPIADDPSSLLALRDAFDDATSEVQLTKGQRQLLREHVMSRRPHAGDVDGIVADYVAKAGWNAPKAAPTATQQIETAAPQQPKTPTNERPASDRGAPPPSKVPLTEMRIQDMSPSERAHFLKEKGHKAYAQKLAADLKGVPVVIKR